MGLLALPLSPTVQQETLQYRFNIDTNSITDLTDLGQGEMESQVEFSGVLSITIEGDARTFRVVLDTLEGSAEGQGQQITPDLLAGIQGATWTGVLDDKGRMSDLVNESESALASQLEGNLLRGFFPYIMAGAKAGSSWSDTLEYSRADSSGTQESTTMVTYTARGDTTYAGMSALVVGAEYTGNTTIFQEAQGGLDIDGGSEGAGVHYVADGGRYLGGVRELQSELEVSGAAIPAIIPVSVATVMTIELMP
jgi:hypothetical protein